MSGTLRIGTRGSALARWQAEWTAQQLRQAGQVVELVVITTQGDVTSGPIGQFGGQGVFTKEIQQSLLRGEVDVAVHSLKDLPTEPVAGLRLAAVPRRESCADVLVSRQGETLDALPVGTKVGTGSQRRAAQLRHYRADLVVTGVRGNVDTRLKKLAAGEYDALVLAEAGLVRLGRRQSITQILPTSIMLPAVGQGALGWETRQDDHDTINLLQSLHDDASFYAVSAEREMLRQLRAGCLAPVGAWGRVENGVLSLDAAVLSVDGSQRISAGGEGEIEEAETVGRRVADELLALGADALIAAAHNQGPAGSAE